MTAGKAPLRIVIAGAAGRMGEAVARRVLEEPGLELAGLVTRNGDAALGTSLHAGGPKLTSDLRLEPGWVLIEFTTAESVAGLARAAAKAGAALVSGTTALTADAEDELTRAAEKVAVVHAPNMSRGVALLHELAARAARVLSDFDLEIEEKHHRHKLDAPSGTAIALGRTLVEARGITPDDLREGRSGRGPRNEREIAIHALRGGDWVGEHTIFLAGPGETVELRHRAESRVAFAAGAVAAARFAAGARPGRYGIRDVLQSALPG